MPAAVGAVRHQHADVVPPRGPGGVGVPLVAEADDVGIGAVVVPGRGGGGRHRRAARCGTGVGAARAVLDAPSHSPVAAEQHQPGGGEPIELGQHAARHAVGADEQHGRTGEPGDRTGGQGVGEARAGGQVRRRNPRAEVLGRQRRRRGAAVGSGHPVDAADDIGELGGDASADAGLAAEDRGAGGTEPAQLAGRGIGQRRPSREQQRGAVADGDRHGGQGVGEHLAAGDVDVGERCRSAAGHLGCGGVAVGAGPAADRASGVAAELGHDGVRHGPGAADDDDLPRSKPIELTNSRRGQRRPGGQQHRSTVDAGRDAGGQCIGEAGAGHDEGDRHARTEPRAGHRCGGGVAIDTLEPLRNPTDGGRRRFGAGCAGEGAGHQGDGEHDACDVGSHRASSRSVVVEPRIVVAGRWVTTAAPADGETGSVGERWQAQLR